MTTKKSDQRLLDQLERLFIKESFREMVLKYRKEIGIPVEGFDSNEEYVSWVKKNNRKFMDIHDVRAEICLRFGFPLNVSERIEGFLLLGDKFKQFDPKNPTAISMSRGFEKPGFACAMEKDGDFQCVDIKVFPGASYRDIMNYVRENMAEIKDFLATFEKRMKPIRKKRQADRDSQIYECYKNNWLSRFGETIDAKKDLVPDSIRKMDMDMRRKIIGEQIKMRK